MSAPLETFARPGLLLLAPLLVLVLWLLERWRRRPASLVVADLSLFEPAPDAVAAAPLRRRRRTLRWLLRALAGVLLVCAAAGPQVGAGPRGSVTVDLVLDCGLAAGLLAPDGGRRIDAHRRHLEQVLERLRPDDRVRLHRLPSPAWPPPALLSPEQVAEALAECRPTAAPGDLDRVLATRAGPGAVGLVYVAADGAPDPPPAGVVVARAAADRPRDRGVVALAQGDDGALYLTVDARGEAQDALRVAVSARGPGGLAGTTLRAAPPADGLVQLAWSVAQGFPRDALEVSARLEGEDDLPDNDAGFAARAQAPARRVGVVGDPGEDVLRALRSVPGVRLEALPEPPDRAGQAALDLLVLPALPREPTEVATVVVPSAVPDALLAPPGPLRPGPARSLLPHALAALAREPQAAVTRLGRPPPGLTGLAPALTVGDAPYLLLGGGGRRLLAVFTGPPRREATTWPLLRSFPALWAELLEAAAPWTEGRLEARPAGGQRRGEERAPFFVGRYRGAEGRPSVGTVAAPLVAPTPGADRPFDPEALAAIDQARPPPPATSLAPWLAALALAPLLLAWAPGRSPTAARASSDG